MTSSRARRYGTLLSVVLALFLTMALAACSGEGDPGGEGTPGSLLERGSEREATQEAGDAEPTREGIFGIGSQSTADPETTDEPTATECLPLASGPASVATDREVLVALFNATDGPNWGYQINWLSDVPLGGWSGVTTNDDGRVTSLDLSFKELSGKIPPELGSLANLTELDLHWNDLSGEIPPELCNLANLETLNLGGNQLSGEIPPWLGNLANLETLNLGRNGLSGEIPSELGNLANLTSLNLGSNVLNGEIPSELGNLANLTSLDLSFNELSGEIPPWLGTLANLKWLILEGNELSGEIPPELGNLANLTELSLRINDLSGEIPPELDNLANLTELGLDRNLLGGCMSDLLRDRSGYDGEIPVCTAEEHPADTEALIALYNATEGPGWDRNDNWLSLDPTGEWEGVSVDANGRVAALTLYANDLSGEIPLELGNLTNLQVLNLGVNDLSGEIPPELGNLTNLQVLNLGVNDLSGEIPPELGNLANLTVLNLSENELNGEIPPELGNLYGLRVRVNRVNIWIGVKFASVSAGERHTCGVRTDGTVACWGVDEGGGGTPPEGQFASVSAGGSLFGDHTCGVRTDGTVACWGDDDGGRATPPEGKFALGQRQGLAHLRVEDRRLRRLLGFG